VPKNSLPRRVIRGIFPLWLCLSFCALPFTPVGVAQGQLSSSSGSSVLLRLRSGAYDPLRVAAVADRTRTAVSDEPSLYLVQFKGPVRAEWRRALESTGAAVLDYVPDFAYLVRASGSAAGHFAGLPGHRWHGSFTSDPRLSSAQA